MSGVRGPTGPKYAPPPRPVAQSQAQATAAPRQTGHANQSVFEDAKKAVDDFKYAGFSQTRLGILKEKTLGEMSQWLDAHPDATPEQAAAEMKSQYNKLTGGTLVEKLTWDTLWKSLEKLLEQKKPKWGE